MSDAPVKKRGFTPAEVQEIYGLSTDLLRRLRHEGGGPPFSRIGYRTVIYRLDDIEAWLEENRVTG